MADELTFVVASLAVLLGGIAVALRLDLGRALDTALAAATLTLAQITVSLLFAGVVLDRLDRRTVLAVSLVVGAALTLAGLRRLAAAARQGRDAWNRLRPAECARAVRSNPFEAALVALASGALAWRLFLASVLPPYGFDALAYHLPTVDTWLQRDRIVLSPLNVCCAAYPSGGELLFAWPALLLGDDTLVDTVQIGFAALGGLAVAGLARSSGLRSWAAAAAGALFVLTPIVLAQASTAYVDVIFASTLLVSVFFCVRFFEGGCRRAGLLVMAGLAAGLCLGTKPNGFLSVGLVASVVLAQLIVAARRGRIRGATLLRAFAPFLAAALTIGGFWYARNAVRLDNPFYPVEVRVLGAEVFQGTVPLARHLIAPPESVDHPWLVSAVASWAHDLPFWRRRIYLFDQRLGGLGPQWIYLGALLLVPYAVAAWRRHRLVFLNFLVPVGIAFLIGPYFWWSRFSIGLAAAGAIATAYFAAAWRADRHGRLLRALVLGLTAASLVIGTQNVAPGSRGRLLSAGDVVRLAGDGSGDRSFGAVFSSGYRWLDRTPKEARIGMARGLLVSPVIGPEFSRRVWFLPKVRGSKLAAFLCSQKIGWVLVHRNDLFDLQAGARPEAFRPVLLSRRVAAYRLDRGVLCAGGR